ncbi:MAG: ATP-dependent zinc metalloprotease FtsH [Phycisphaeraceae bacterium]|nr:MAG: ATP-dependent zinc metalloprotease FtsH [Phycisphaeraceae bacterium]
MLLGLVLLFLIVLQAGQPRRTDTTFASFEAYVQEGVLENIVVGYEAITADPKKLSPEEQQSSGRVPPSTPIRVTITTGPGREFWLSKVDAITGSDFFDRSAPPWWRQLLMSGLLIWILLFAIIWFFIFRMMRQAGGGGGVLGNFGKSRHRVLAKETTGITFNDVAGIDEAKDEVFEIVEFLKNPKKFMRLGGRIPRGVLLVGDPGCGKTLLAKAIAGEADVPFFSISGSDFVEMFVGVGASRVRDLFKQAKESAPCIIFLDEIDAVGRRRGGGFSSGGHDEREQTLNAILVEMDGFESSDQVIVIAATNRSDVLDPALTRPGRFDRQVIVSLPDLKGRLEILRVHTRKIKIGPDVDLEKIARGTPMFSGAELAALVNEAAIIATLEEKEFVEHDDLEEARDKIRFGRSRKSRKIEEKERIATAYHEAGHAVLQAMLPDVDPLHKVTIIPRGNFGGATFSLPERDRYGYGLKWLQSTMRVVCGGRIAEERKTSDITSGAAQDIQQLTMMARAMVLEWGMSDRLGFVRYAGSDTREAMMRERDYSDGTAEVIDQEIRRYAEDAYSDAERILNENWDKVVAVAEALLKHETLTAEEVDTLMRGEALNKPSVSDLLALEARKHKDAASKAPEKKSKPDDEIGPGVVPSPA